MNEIKEIFESINSRIRSPYFGFFILYSIGLNWKAWLLLMFEKSSISERILCFDEHTSFATIIIIPLLLGFLTALITPWLKLFFIWAASIPVTKRNLLQARSESEILEEKSRLERARASLLGTEEESLIAKAERDVKISSIEDAEAREKLEKEIEELRSKVGSGIKATGTVISSEKKPRISVKLKKNPVGNGYRFYVKNTGNDVAYNVKFNLLLKEGASSPLTSDVKEVFPVVELHPNDEVSVLAAISMGMSSKFDIELTWESSKGEKESKRTSVTL